MSNAFSIKSIRFYNGNKNLRLELLNKTLDKTTTHLIINNDKKLLNTLQHLENACQVNYEETDITIITNSFYENSLELLKLLKNFPKLFGNTKVIKVCVTTFLIMGFDPLRDEIPERVKASFRKFQNEATNIGYRLVDHHGEKLVLDTKQYLFSDFI
jgi:hypothetical protein